MLMFCPTCGNVLRVEEAVAGLRFACNTCPYIFNIVRRVSSRTYPKLKEVDDVLGGSAAWENVDSTEERCPKCSNPRAYFMQIQTRSADEPMTTFLQMLQSSMWSQLARLKCYFLLGGKRTISYARETGPMSTLLNSAHEEVEALNWHGNHWMCKGKRTLAVAVALLQRNEIIAVPTDTIYGLACLVSSTSAIEKLYEIKKREVDKPLSICVNNLKDIRTWGVVDHVPITLLSWLLPGPYTIILKRTPALNPALNPNHDTVGIRVLNNKFMKHVTEVAGPLALTSANISNEPSCLYASEFENLWNKLGGIFHNARQFGKAHNYLRSGSTIIDLSEPGRYKIIRYGIRAKEAERS